MHDVLFRFRRELLGNLYNDRVYQDMDSGQESGVSWTPTFFLNGERYPLARDFDGLVRLVRERVERTR